MSTKKSRKRKEKSAAFFRQLVCDGFFSLSLNGWLIGHDEDNCRGLEAKDYYSRCAEEECLWWCWRPPCLSLPRGLRRLRLSVNFSRSQRCGSPACAWLVVHSNVPPCTHTPDAVPASQRCTVDQGTSAGCLHGGPAASTQPGTRCRPHPGSARQTWANPDLLL